MNVFHVNDVGMELLMQLFPDKPSEDICKCYEIIRFSRILSSSVRHHYGQSSRFAIAQSLIVIEDIGFEFDSTVTIEGESQLMSMDYQPVAILSDKQKREE